jgi:hypothetical protein
VELVVQWFFSNVTDTVAYAITDPANPMRTSTDAEVTAFVAAAKALGMKVVFSPMLDPDWTLPSQLGCRDNHDDPACFWRGQIGALWPDAPAACTPAAAPEWAAWHDWYASFVLHYARLAAATGMDGLVLAHELDRPVENCADRWTALVGAVRAAYGGALSVAQGSYVVFKAAPATLAWVKTLDYVGIECYQGSLAPAPAVPWRDAPPADLAAGLLASLDGFAAFHNATGMQLACTEGGWLAAPWAGEGGWGTLLDPADTTVHFLDNFGASQAAAYTALLTVIEAQPWYAGGWYWFWRADPTAGGTSDPSPVPWAKEAAEAIAAVWRA